MTRTDGRRTIAVRSPCQARKKGRCKGNDDTERETEGTRSDRTVEPGETGSVEAQAEESGQGCMSKNFWNNIPADCQKAINELKRLKVFNLCAWGYEETFSDVWWLVLHEVDMYAEGEFVREASRSYFHTGDLEAMNLKQAQRADSWLLKWKHLFEKYTNPVYYSDDYYKVHVGFTDYSDSSYHYDGQVI